MQGCRLSAKQLREIKPAFSQVIKTKIDSEKDYLAYFVTDRIDNTSDTAENDEIKRLCPILKQIKALLWIYPG